MTIIDTTLYCNGALRLSRHGKGRGGNILLLTQGDGEGGRHVEQITIPDAIVADVEYFIGVDSSVDGDARRVYDLAKRYVRTWYENGGLKPTA